MERTNTEFRTERFRVKNEQKDLRSIQIWRLKNKDWSIFDIAQLFDIKESTVRSIVQSELLKAPRVRQELIESIHESKPYKFDNDYMAPEVKQELGRKASWEE